MPCVRSTILFFILLLAGLTGCNQSDGTQVVTVIATRPQTEVTRLVTQIIPVPITLTPSPPQITITPPPKHLTVCLLTEPESLYWYDNAPFGAAAQAKEAIHHAIYENLYTTLDYGFQAQGLVKLPQLGDGDVLITEVAVNSGDTVVNSQNQVVTLAEGTRLRTSDNQEIIFSGQAITLPQMQVQFTLRPLVWSDGQPVTAQDSVFSYKVARDLSTPTDKERVSRTAAYVATGERTVSWQGIPGWLDPFYFTNVWMPLPIHQLAGFAAADLLTAPETTLTPLSTGPFVIQEWLPGEVIHLSRNEFYYRHAEGLPYLDSLTFRFIDNSEQLLALLLSGECHIGLQDGLDLSQASLLQEAESRGLLQPYFQTTTVFEHLDFGINSDEVYAVKRPDWFEDVRVRQAVAQCINRQALVESVLYGLGQVSDLFVPPDYPFIPDDLAGWGYDVAAANALLDEVGYADLNGDGIRQYPSHVKPFRVTLGITQNNPIQQQLAHLVTQNLADCGIELVTVTHLPGEWFAPQGSLFGRRFDLAIFPWITNPKAACLLYTTASIPDEGNNWQGNNEMGWRYTPFDEACGEMQRAFWGSEAFAAATETTFRLFVEQVPSLPLFHYLKVSATLPTVQNFRPNSSQPSELWNLYELDLLPP